MVNISFAIFDKTGTVVQADTPFTDLYTGSGLTACETENDGDPIVVYDSLADRWLLSQFAVSSGTRMCIAISQTPDPTGAYYLYQFDMPDFPDYFKFGVWEDAYYMGTNTGFPNQYYAYAFDRVNMLAGNPATFQYSNGHPNFLMPADLDGPTPAPTGAPGLFYTMLSDGYPDHPAGVDRLALYEFDVDWATPANTTFGLSQEIPISAYNYTVCGFFVGDCIPQPGTAQGLDSLSYWPMWRFGYRNLGSYQALVGNFTVDLDGSDKAAIRWFELRDSGPSWTLHQEGTHAPDGDHRWMASIAMDGSGNIALGYSTSSATTIPSIRYATRLATDPLGTLQAEATIIDSAGVHTGIHRWGDYSSINVDPTDECTFWYTNQYDVANNTGFDWHTRVGVFKIPECTGTLSDTFTVTADPAQQSICTPSDALYEVTVNRIGAFSQDVTLSAVNVPTGYSESFSPNPVVTGTLTSTMTLMDVGGAVAGSYSIDVVGMGLTDTQTATVGLDVFTAVPSVPTLTDPADAATDVSLVPTFMWTASSQGTTYELEVATDAGFTNIIYSTVVAGTSHDMVGALNALTTYYWRVRSANICGTGSDSATFSFETADIPPVLLVDDDDNSPDVQSSYTAVLDALLGSGNYDIWDTNNTDNEPTAVDLAPYTTVIWFSGDEFGGFAGPGAAGEAALGTWLDNGNCLFISSQDYHFDRGLTTFMQNYLGAANITNDNGDYTSVTGQGLVFTGFGPYALSYPFTDYSDPITPDGTAEVAFVGNNANNAAIDKDSGVYRTSFWTYPFEALPAGADQEAVMQHILDWCGSGVDVGSLEGQVTDADSSLGIEGAMITADDGAFPRTTTTDVNGDYSITLPIGTYTVTAEATNYMSQTVGGAVIVTDTITVQDFALSGSHLTYSPPEIEEFMSIGDVVTNTVTVTNSGPLELEIDVNIGNFNDPSLLNPIAIPASDSNFIRGAAAPSIEAAPAAEATGSAQNSANNLTALLGGSPAYGVEIIGDTFNSLLTNDPGNLTLISSASGAALFAGDFLNGDFSTLYALDFNTNNLVAVDTTTGAQTTIGNAVPDPGQSWAGMAGDATSGTMYALSTDCTNNTLYTIDVTNAALTPVGTGTGACVIDIAVNAAGEMYGMDIIGDNMVSIDKTIGALTVIGSTGFDANFAQGMDFDEDAGILYLAAYNNAISGAELRIADTATGATTLVGPIGAGAGLEMDAFAIATGGGGSSGWAYAVPDNGIIIPAGGTTTFDVVFDSSSLYVVGDYTAELSFSGNFVNMVPVMPLTMHLDCPTCSFLDGNITDSMTNNPVAADIHITSTNGFDVMLAGESYAIAVQPGDYNFTVSAAGYFSQTATVTAVQAMTVTTDFALVYIFGELTNDPGSYDVTVALGYSQTLPLDLSNIGTIDVFYDIKEQNGGYTSTLPLANATGQGEIIWLYRNTDGVPVQTSDSGATVAYPGAYQYVPENVVEGGPNILVYTDDWIHTTPNTLVQDALTRLGLAATVHIDGDYTGFETSLTTGGPWDLVIWSGENFVPPATTMPALLTYLQGGGKLAATYWRQLDHPTDPLWTEIGFTYINNYITPPSTYWWDSGHPLFNNPESAPEWINRVQNSGTSQGTQLEPLANGIALAGYTTTPTTNEAGIILRDDGNAIYKGLRDVSTDVDEDMDSVLDGTELWENIITGLLDGFGGGEIPWLHQDPISDTVAAMTTNVVDIVFDATVLTQTGQYYGTMLVSNDAHGDLAIPVTMTVVPAVFDVVVTQDAALTNTVGSTVTYTVYVTNTGNAPDTYDLSMSGNSWNTSLSDSSISLGAGEGTMVWVTVDIPVAATDGEMDAVTVTATSQGDNSASGSVTLTTTAEIPIVYIYLPFVVKQ